MFSQNLRTVFLLACAVLAACTPLPPAPAPASAPATLAAMPAPAWQRQGVRLLHIAPDESLLTITVRRGGALARLGHDHVVASRSLQGVVAPALGRAQFRFRLDEMSVDEAGLRQAAGLTTTPRRASRHAPQHAGGACSRRNAIGVRSTRATATSRFRCDITCMGARTVQCRCGSRGGRWTPLQAAEPAVETKRLRHRPFAVLGGAMAVRIDGTGFALPPARRQRARITASQADEDGAATRSAQARRAGGGEPQADGAGKNSEQAEQHARLRRKPRPSCALPAGIAWPATMPRRKTGKKHDFRIDTVGKQPLPNSAARIRREGRRAIDSGAATSAQGADDQPHKI